MVSVGAAQCSVQGRRLDRRQENGHPDLVDEGRAVAVVPECGVSVELTNSQVTVLMRATTMRLDQYGLATRRNYHREISIVD
jgi:hypothetical protein